MNYIKISKNDIANGIGVGCVLWVSGCDIHCKNCHNQSTWDYNAGKPFTEDTMQELLFELTKPYITHITISGGHPLDPLNAPEVLKIVKRVKMVFPNKDIWIYSGYEWEDIIKDETLREILKYTDVLVDGAYVDELRDISLAFRGSSNQRIIDVKKSLAENKIILWEEV